MVARVSLTGSHRHYELGQLSMALTMWEEAAEIRKQTLGDRHPDTGLCYNNIACCVYKPSG